MKKRRTKKSVKKVTKKRRRRRRYTRKKKLSPTRRPRTVKSSRVGKQKLKFYCAGCRKPRTATIEKVTMTRNKRKMAVGHCPAGHRAVQFISMKSTK